MSGRTLILLTIYAVAMAMLESASVVYMRRLYLTDDPLNIFSLHFPVDLQLTNASNLVEGAA